ncbi:unnamed protein product [Acanthoscelides obtectus]|uniref:Uncharacterized protein n=1 Tax=Acanthoscelides obtectus TaxID=200917 RepID=A0A9P0KLR1_ACAOB|nr:unnamed protein product [Acanthoscelides obtectus]CAK1647682.1 hypothetical protein AOBTE_LOCUS15336 [Acanthoscelides obtectus]
MSSRSITQPKICENLNKLEQNPDIISRKARKNPDEATCPLITRLHLHRKPRNKIKSISGSKTSYDITSIKYDNQVVSDKSAIPEIFAGVYSAHSSEINYEYSPCFLQYKSHIEGDTITILNDNNTSTDNAQQFVVDELMMLETQESQAQFQVPNTPNRCLLPSTSRLETPTTSSSD